MRISVSGDWHLGHAKMVREGYRPGDYEERLMDSHAAALRRDDLLVNLGDWSMSSDGNRKLGLFLEGLSESGVRLWTVQGNHDPDSIGKALALGWHFASHSFRLRMFGRSIEFTHEPAMAPAAPDDRWLNIHGHLHLLVGHRGGFALDGQHAMYSGELADYRPVPLETLIKLVVPQWKGGKWIEAEGLRPAAVTA